MTDSTPYETVRALLNREPVQRFNNSANNTTQGGHLVAGLGSHTCASAKFHGIAFALVGVGSSIVGNDTFRFNTSSFMKKHQPSPEPNARASLV